VQPGDCCALVYTSGTTGNPKGVMVSHDNMAYNARSLLESAIQSGYKLNSQALRVVSYLPLNHTAAKRTDIMAPLLFTSFYNYHAEVYICKPDALKGSFIETMRRCRPTMFFGVPRVWDILQRCLKTEVTTNYIMAKLENYGMKLGEIWYENSHVGKGGYYPMLWPFFDRFVFSRVKAKIGLDKCVLICSGAAPMQAVVYQWFGSQGIQIITTYGVSESSGLAAINLGWNYGPRAAGQPLLGGRIKIDPVSRDRDGQGEILISGRSNMMGYLNMAKKTAGTISNGWIYTGDLGKFVDGNLYITGRLKEIIVTLEGGNVAPVPIEHHCKKLLPALSNFIMIGNMRAFNVALVSLKTANDPTTGALTNKLTADALKVSPNSKTVEQAMKDPVWKRYIEDGLEAYNNDTVICPQPDYKIKDYRILPQDLSIAGDELGPTLKVKRPVVDKKYKSLIEEMY